ncbi:MAG: hypothetical protein J6N95_01220 [Bacilli bacterium]|nr:hypothetical protein [Bacilli bacterium]
MSRCNDEYKKFDEEYERLEVQPYNAAYDYYSGGWNTAIMAMSDRIKELIEKAGLSDSIGKFVSIAQVELTQENHNIDS